MGTTRCNSGKSLRSTGHVQNRNASIVLEDPSNLKSTGRKWVANVEPTGQSAKTTVQDNTKYALSTSQFWRSLSVAFLGQEHVGDPQVGVQGGGRTLGVSRGSSFFLQCRVLHTPQLVSLGSISTFTRSELARSVQKSLLHIHDTCQFLEASLCVKL